MNTRRASQWATPLAIALWAGVTVVLADLLLLASKPLGHYPRVVETAVWLAGFIGPVWPLELVAGILIVASSLALLFDRLGTLRLAEGSIALDLVGESGQWAMLAGLLGTFLGLVTSLQAIDGREQQEMLAQLMRGTGTAIGSTVVSTVEGFLASVFRFIFARIWRGEEGDHVSAS